MVKKSQTESRSWYALYTKPRSEFKAEEQINSKDISVYLPSIIKVRQWSDRKKKVKVPLLQGYIFIFATEQERLIAVESEAVVKCIFSSGKPAKIPDWQIDNLKQLLENDSDFLVAKGLLPGTKVKIVDGPFNGVTGVLQSHQGRNNLVVAIDLLNRSIIVHLPEESVIKTFT